MVDSGSAMDIASLVSSPEDLRLYVRFLWVEGRLAEHSGRDEQAAPLFAAAQLLCKAAAAQNEPSDGEKQ